MNAISLSIFTRNGLQTKLLIITQRKVYSQTYTYAAHERVCESRVKSLGETVGTSDILKAKTYNGYVHGK